MAHHHHGHSHSHDIGHIESAARTQWEKIAPAPRSLAGFDELAVRLCMAQAAHRPCAKPAAGLHFNAEISASAISASRNALSTALQVPYEVVALQPVPGNETLSLPNARAAMKAGSTAASLVMKEGAKVVLLSMNPFPKENAAALLSWLFEIDIEKAVACFCRAPDDAAINNAVQVKNSIEQRQNPVAGFAAFGNIELLAITGAVLQAGSHGRAVLFDGLASALGGAAAAKIDPSVKHSMFAAADEKQRDALIGLEITPVFTNPGGAGVGALLALHQLGLAADLMNNTS